ncbi:MAG: hypothetical protein IJO27_01770 [Bacilli bacterium]|nr:hypothetical protein [Bacilli bacterium]
MSSDLGLLDKIGNDLNVYKCDGEQESDWIVRLAYSLLARNAYASLWDENGTISINHFKQRIIDLIEALKILFPVIYNQLFNEDSIKLLADYIYDLYLNTGYFYHENNRVTFSSYKFSNEKNVKFIRSPRPKDNVYMSGIGYYTEIDGTNENTVAGIYNFSNNDLDLVLNKIEIDMEFIEFLGDNNSIEYLRMDNYKRGYWKRDVDKNLNISMLRTGEEGARIYYLYKYDNNKLLVSRLPQCLVENGAYRLLSLSIMKRNNKLPKISYHILGDLVEVSLNYLLPRNEQDFFELYSWPNSLIAFNRFNRKMNKRVFFDFKKQLEKLGHEFEERY